MAVVEVAPAPPALRADVEDVLRAGGFTRFHRRAVAVTGFAWTFVAMEILLVGFTVPIFTGLWSLSGSYAGWITASALAGSLVGSVTLGRLADRIGRRQIFQASILWYAVFTAATAFAWGPGSVSAFRFLAGLGLGGHARRRPLHACRIPAPAAARPLPRPARLLLAGRAAARHRAVLALPRAGGRRLGLALPLPGRGLPGIPRLRRPPHAA